MGIIIPNQSFNNLGFIIPNMFAIRMDIIAMGRMVNQLVENFSLWIWIDLVGRTSTDSGN